MFIINSYIIGTSTGTTPTTPVASDLAITGTSGVVSLSYTYSSPSSFNEGVGITWWESIDLSGTFEPESTITATTTPSGTYTYQWYLSDDNQGTNDTIISGATGSSYTLLFTEVSKYLRVVATDTLGDYYSSWYEIITQAATLEGGMVNVNNTSSLLLFFDRPMTLTDESGYTVNVDSSGNTVTGATAFENTITLELTDAITTNQIVECTYNGSGNTITVIGSVLSSFNDRIVDNIIGNTFGTKIQMNASRFADFVGGNWNEPDVDPSVVADDIVANMVDSGGTSTGISWGLTKGYDDWYDRGDTGSTTNFPNPVYKRIYRMDDETGGNGEGEHRWTGFTAFEWVQITYANLIKESGPDYVTASALIGHNTYTIPTSNASTSEFSGIVRADSNGEIKLSQYWNSVVENQLNYFAGAMIEKGETDFNPMIFGWDTVLTPEGSAKNMNAIGVWDNPYGSLGNGVEGVANLPTYNSTTRTVNFDIDNSEALQIDKNTYTDNLDIFIEFEAATSPAYMHLIGLSNSLHLRYETDGVLSWGNDELGYTATDNVTYRMHLFISGASSTVEIRDNTNSVLLAETGFTANGATAGAGIGYIGAHYLGINNKYDGSIKTVFIGKNLGLTAQNITDMFQYINDKL